MAPPFAARHPGRPLPRLPLLAVLSVMGACGPPGAAQVQPAAPVTPPGTAPSRGPDTAALARDIPRLLRVSDIPGLSMAVVQQGRVTWARAFGTVNDSARTPLDAGTVFEAASLSKPVFAYLVLRLADRGEFDLDRPLFEMLEYPRLAHDERYKRITARMVLSHGTGLPNWGGERLTLAVRPGNRVRVLRRGIRLPSEGARACHRPLARSACPARGVPAARHDALELRLAEALRRPRGVRQGLALARRAGQSLHRGEANAAASLLTTATDYARFVAAVLTGRGLSPRMWGEFLTPVRETSPGLYVGLGIRVEDGPSGRVFYHSGNNGRRFTSYMTGDIAKEIGLVYFTGAYNGTSLVAALAAPVLRRGSPGAPSDGLRPVRRSAPGRAAVGASTQPWTAAPTRRVRGSGPSARAPISGCPSTTPCSSAPSSPGEACIRFRSKCSDSAVADAPDSASAHLALGRALESAGDLRAAIESYRRAEALEADSGDARAQIQWVEDRLAVRAHPVAVPPRTLKSYAGRYQERTIAMHDGRLYYRRGASPESPLTPMAEDRFELEADPALRIRFDTDGAGPAAKLIEIYSDGTIDESVRSR